MTVLPFVPRQTPKPERGPLVLSFDVYENLDGDSYIVTRYDGQAPDIENTVDRANELLAYLYQDLHEVTKDPEHELLVTLQLFPDSTRITWMNDDIAAPKGRAWVNRVLLNWIEHNRPKLRFPTPPLRRKKRP